MPENQYDQADKGQNRLTQIQKHLEELAPEELQTEFETFFLTSEEGSMDLEVLDLYLDQLDKISPIETEMTGMTIEESKEAFADKYAGLLEQRGAADTPPKKRKRIRVLAVAAIAAAFVGILVGQVSGFKWMGDFAHWTSEIFSVSTRDYSVENQWNPEYDDLRAALRENGIDENIIPKYLPEGCEQTELIVEPETLFFSARYENGVESIMVRVVGATGNEHLRMQKLQTDPEIYIAGNTEHHIIMNSDVLQYQAYWQKDNFECAIYGAPTKDILIRMIDSIYTEAILWNEDLYDSLRCF